MNIYNNGKKSKLWGILKKIYHQFRKFGIYYDYSQNNTNYFVFVFVSFHFTQLTKTSDQVVLRYV